MKQLGADAYSELCKTFKKKHFEKIIEGFQLLTVFAKRFILDAWQGFEYASEMELTFHFF